MEIEALKREVLQISSLSSAQSRELEHLRGEITCLETELERTIESYNNLIMEFKKGNCSNVSLINESMMENSFLIKKTHNNNQVETSNKNQMETSNKNQVETSNKNQMNFSNKNQVETSNQNPLDPLSKFS